MVGFQARIQQYPPLKLSLKVGGVEEEEEKEKEEEKKIQRSLFFPSSSSFLFTNQEKMLTLDVERRCGDSSVVRVVMVSSNLRRSAEMACVRRVWKMGAKKEALVAFTTVRRYKSQLCAQDIRKKI